MSTAVVADQQAWYLNRWTQLVLGVIAMMAISSPQYTWTLFTGPLNQKLGTTLAELQWAFSLLIILQTWFSPFQAYLVDRFGPRLLISVGALLSGGSWVLAASAGNLWALYLTDGAPIAANCRRLSGSVDRLPTTTIFCRAIGNTLTQSRA
jgi:MFS family permease